MKYCEKCKEDNDLPDRSSKLFGDTCDICGQKTVTVNFDTEIKIIKESKDV
jgi:hypothetical protein